MYNIMDPKLFHSDFPGKISAEEAAYRKAVDALIEKVSFISGILTFLESDIHMKAYFTRGQELYFVIIDEGFSGPSASVLHKHSCRSAEDENINTFSSAMDICLAFAKSYLATYANLPKYLGELECLYLDVLSTHEAL